MWLWTQPDPIKHHAEGDSPRCCSVARSAVRTSLRVALKQKNRRPPPPLSGLACSQAAAGQRAACKYASEAFGLGVQGTEMFICEVSGVCLHLGIRSPTAGLYFASRCASRFCCVWAARLMRHLICCSAKTATSLGSFARCDARNCSRMYCKP